MSYLTLHYWDPERITTASVAFLPELFTIFLWSHPLTLHGVFLDIFVYLSVMCFLTVAYRLSPFHPLARFPGPTLNKITQLREMWTTGTNAFHLVHHGLHQKYGPIVRVGG